jgi:tetratricopeptide (TPR) repeat protein
VALASAEEAVKHYRALATTRPDAFLSYLAMSLNNLGAMQSDLGHREAALSSSREAVWLYLRFARVLPARFMEPLMISAQGLIRDLKNAGMPLEKESLLGDVIGLLESQQGADGSTSS